MPVAFPAICPTSTAGATTVRLYGSRASSARLSLKFAVSDAQAATYVTAYLAARGDSDFLTLPPAVWEGASSALVASMPTYVRWRFDGPPSVANVFPGRSEVSVELVGLLEA
jgi:hypothetical protein